MFIKMAKEGIGMNKKTITCTSVIIDGEEMYESAFTADGWIHIDGDQLVQIDFREPQLSENGVEMVSKLVVHKESIELFRHGEAIMKQRFESGVAHAGSYEVEQGSFETLAHTLDLQINCDINQGTITILYDFYLNKTKSGTFQLEIRYQD